MFRQCIWLVNTGVAEWRGMRQVVTPDVSRPRWLDGYIRHVCHECGAPEVIPDDVSCYLPDMMTLSAIHIPVGQLLKVQYMHNDELTIRFMSVTA